MKYPKIGDPQDVRIFPKTKKVPLLRDSFGQNPFFGSPIGCGNLVVEGLRVYLLRMKPSQFVSAFIPVQGQQFHFADPDPKRHWNWREYFYPIYDNLYREIVLKTGRQVEKSTGQANRYIAYSALIPYFRSIYVAPTAKQARIFSNDRLRKSIRTSPFLAKYYVDQKTTDQVFETTLVNESTIFIGYAFLTADTMRGLSADMLGIDEFQDIISDNVPVLRETLTHSDHKLLMLTGTPKTFDNHLEREWQTSFQAVWSIRCKRCNKMNYMDEEPYELIGKTSIVCRKCKRTIYTQDGMWVKKNPKAEKAGFHISQLQTGRIQRKMDFQDLLNKIESYPDYRIYNEVFGLSFDSSTKPITIQMMRQLSTGVVLSEYDPNVLGVSSLFAGVDWGENKGSYTVLTIGGLNLEGKFQVFYIRKFSPNESRNPDYVINEIVDAFNRFRCVALMADHGAGHKENLRLQSIIGQDRVWEIFYANQREPIKWDEKRLMYIADRTTMMDNLIYPIQNGDVIFPNWDEIMGAPIGYDEGRSLADDFVAIEREYSERLRKFVYDHRDPDDAFHSTLYTKVAAHLHHGTPFV